MKKIEKKIYNEIVLQAYNDFPEEGKIEVDDPEKKLFREWVGDQKKIYMYTAYTPDKLRVGVVGVRGMLKSVPNCTFAFGDLQSFFDFIKRNNISAKFPFIKKEEVANEPV